MFRPLNNVYIEETETLLRTKDCCTHSFFNNVYVLSGGATVSMVYWSSSWLQIQRSGFDSRLYQIFWEVVGLERDPLSLVSTIEELLERKNRGSGLENRELGSRDPPRWPRGTLYPQKLALTSPTSGDR
jgi:hypothetical protein